MSWKNKLRNRVLWRVHREYRTVLLFIFSLIIILVLMFWGSPSFKLSSCLPAVCSCFILKIPCWCVVVTLHFLSWFHFLLPLWLPHMCCTWCSSPCLVWCIFHRDIFLSLPVCVMHLFFFFFPWCCPSVALNPDLLIVSRKSSRSSHTNVWQSLMETFMSGHRVQKGKTTVHSIYVKDEVYIHSR